MPQERSAYRVGFILEQTLGHVTHSANLQQNVAGDPTVQPLWGLIPWASEGWAVRVPGYGSNWTLRAGLRARRVLGRMAHTAQPDALFFHTQVAAVLVPDWLARLPSVVSLDATPLQYDSLGTQYGHTTGGGWVEAQKKRLNRLCFTRARRLVTWSDWTAQSLIRDYGVAADKITVIPPGVTTAAWARAAPRTPHAGPVKVLFVGGDLERKGGLLLLEAMRLLRTELAQADGGLELELHLVTRTQVQAEPGLFVYYGMQPNSPDLKALFHACDIFCLPTLGDCLPMVLSEAGAAGLPLLATDVGAIGEIVRDGQTGRLVEAGSLAALVAALRDLVEAPELRLRLGEQAWQWVRRRYDAVDNTQQLLELIKVTVDEERVGHGARESTGDMHVGRVGHGHR
jgi:glycosyltransferase involved in cell wall biosynthesis